MDSFKKEMHGKEATRDMATEAVAVDDFGLSNQIVTCGMVCPCAFATVTNRLVELDSRCRFVDWLLERWQSVNDCNEQKECDLKGNERRRGFR